MAIKFLNSSHEIKDIVVYGTYHNSNLTDIKGWLTDNNDKPDPIPLRLSGPPLVGKTTLFKYACIQQSIHPFFITTKYTDSETINRVFWAKEIHLTLSDFQDDLWQRGRDEISYALCYIRALEKNEDGGHNMSSETRVEEFKESYPNIFSSNIEIVLKEPNVDYQIYKTVYKEILKKQNYYWGVLYDAYCLFRDISTANGTTPTQFGKALDTLLSYLNLSKTFNTCIVNLNFQQKIETIRRFFEIYDLKELKNLEETPYQTNTINTGVMRKLSGEAMASQEILFQYPTYIEAQEIIRLLEPNKQAPSEPNTIFPYVKADNQTFSISDQKIIIETILEWTACHPLLILVFCEILYRKLRTETNFPKGIRNYVDEVVAPDVLYFRWDDIRKVVLCIDSSDFEKLDHFCLFENEPPPYEWLQKLHKCYGISFSANRNVTYKISKLIKRYFRLRSIY